jgi:glycosyltransferase involved in cell wall biosynthesis
MTLYNQARHLPEALESLVAQSDRDFRLVLLDDGSTDGTEALARSYAARDPRLEYHRHAARQGMIATWREVAERACGAHPTARYFAWVSDHDRWHPGWLARLRGALDAAPEAVLAYPLVQRLAPEGAPVDRPPRRFDTAGVADVRERWRRFCRNGAGAGDMVYGLVRIPALQAAGVFRPVLRPDRLLVAELVLRGEIRQVDEVLWFRRNAVEASVARQRTTLLLPGTEPAWFGQPPWMQHAAQLRRHYGAETLARLGLSPAAWRWMRVCYQAGWGWRHARKSEASHVLGRGLDRVILAWKLTKHYARHAVYRILVAWHAARGRS